MTQENEKFLRAFAIHDFEEMTALLNLGADINATDEQGQTPLMLSAARNHIDGVEFLIKNGAKIDCQAENAFSDSRYSALMYAIEYGSLACVKLLLESGANIHLTNKFQRTALHIVCEQCRIEYNSVAIAQLLIQYGADINARDLQDNTPLITACCRMETNTDLVKLLLENGADVNLKNFKDESVIDIANIDLFSDELAAIVFHYQEAFIEKGKLLDAIDQNDTVLPDSPLVF